MRKIKKDKKNSLSKFLFSSAILACLGLIVIFIISIPLVKSLNQKNQVKEEISVIQQEIDNLKSENQDLENLIEYLNSDQFLEEQARLNFGLKRQGENVVVVTDKEKVAGVSTTSQAIFGDRNSEPEKSNPQKWFAYFFEN